MLLPRRLKSAKDTFCAKRKKKNRKSMTFRGSRVSESQCTAAWTRLALADATVPNADALTFLLLGAHSIELEMLNFQMKYGYQINRTNYF